LQIERRRYYVILGMLMILSIAFAIYSITLNVKTKKEIVVERYSFHDSLDYYVYLKPNFLFNRTVLKNSIIYVNITKGIVVYYFFSSRCFNGSINGSYDVIADVKTKEWSKTITLIPEKTFKNSYMLKFSIDLQYFRSIYERINRELGFKGTDPEVTITIETKIEAKNYSDVYTHTLSFPLTSKVFKITTQHTTSKIKTLKRTVYVFDDCKNLIRITTGILSVLIFLCACVFKWRVKPIKIEKDLATLVYEKNKDFIVLGKLEMGKANVVVVESFEELLKIAEILNKPIIKDGKRFGLVDGQTIYIFEFKE